MRLGVGGVSPGTQSFCLPFIKLDESLVPSKRLFGQAFSCCCFFLSSVLRCSVWLAEQSTSFPCLPWSTNFEMFAFLARRSSLCGLVVSKSFCWSAIYIFLILGQQTMGIAKSTKQPRESLSPRTSFSRTRVTVVTWRSRDQLSSRLRFEGSRCLRVSSPSSVGGWEASRADHIYSDHRPAHHPRVRWLHAPSHEGQWPATWHVAFYDATPHSSVCVSANHHVTRNIPHCFVVCCVCFQLLNAEMTAANDLTLSKTQTEVSPVPFYETMYGSCLWILYRQQVHHVPRYESFYRFIPILHQMSQY